MANETSGAIPDVRLNNGVDIPQLGLGAYEIPVEQTEAAFDAAFSLGYRHFDTASLYGNEAQVGAAARRDGRRSETFLTTKIWKSDMGHATASVAFEAAMSRMGLDTIDLLLIHWPDEDPGVTHETWRALEGLLERGRVRAIGVSNFDVTDLTRLLDIAEVTPAVNQVRLNPYEPNTELRQFHAQHGIVTQAWAPLGRGGALLSDPRVVQVADRVGRTPAQVVLRWSVELGNVIIPKSISPARMAENRAIFDFGLDPASHLLLDSCADGPAADAVAGGASS